MNPYEIAFYATCYVLGLCAVTTLAVMICLGVVPA